MTGFMGPPPVPGQDLDGIPLAIAQLPRRPIMERMWARLCLFRKPEDRGAPVRRGNLFYGWYDDAAQDVAFPSYDPPHDGPCLYCGNPIHQADVRTFSVMMMGPHYAKRSYFYRTHATCNEMDLDKGIDIDALVWGMIARNGD